MTDDIQAPDEVWAKPKLQISFGGEVRPAGQWFKVSPNSYAAAIREAGKGTIELNDYRDLFGDTKIVAIASSKRCQEEATRARLDFVTTHSDVPDSTDLVLVLNKRGTEIMRRPVLLATLLGYKKWDFFVAFRHSADEVNLNQINFRGKDEAAKIFGSKFHMRVPVYSSDWFMYRHGKKDMKTLLGHLDKLRDDYGMPLDEALTTALYMTKCYRVALPESWQ